MKIALFLVLSIFLLRLLPILGGNEALKLMANFSPLIALMLCGGAYFSRRGRFLPLAAFIGSDLILNVFWHFKLGGKGEGLVSAAFGWHTLIALAVFAFIVFGGVLLKGKRARVRVPLLLAGSVLGSLLFYVITNTGSFFMLSGYEKSLSGWIQCLTVGLPGLPPTWTFLVKSLAANVAFTGIFVALFDWKTKPATLLDPVGASSN